VAGAAPSRRRRADHLLVALAGLAVLVACGLVARHGTVGPAERQVFHGVNDLPQWLYRPMWAFQQVGNLLVALAVILLVALLLRRPWLAAAAVVGVAAKLGLERVVKLVVERQRPGTSVGGATLRGAVPAHGLSFVSGHAVITAAFATLLTPVLPGRWKVLPWALVLLNAVARVYVGAHNPLDVVGGAGLGVFIGGVLNAAVAPAGARSGSQQGAPVDTAVS
jgi:undecaprenyl-diphosphatase